MSDPLAPLDPATPPQVCEVWRQWLLFQKESASGACEFSFASWSLVTYGVLLVAVVVIGYLIYRNNKKKAQQMM